MSFSLFSRIRAKIPAALAALAAQKEPGSAASIAIASTELLAIRVGGTDDLSDFKARLGRLLAGTGNALTGRIQMIGLGKIREHFGERWEKVAERAHDIARAEIRHHMTPKDLYTSYDEENYVVIFGSLDKASAKIKCTAIAEEIARKLVGDRSAHQLAEARSVAVDANGEINFQSIDKIAAIDEATREERELSSGGDAHHKEAKPEFVPGLTAAERIVARDLMLKELTFVYRPMWTVASKAITTYLAVPRIVDDTGSSLMGPHLWSQMAGWMSRAEFDAYIVKRAAEELGACTNRGQKLLMAVTVDYRVFATTREKQILLASLHKIPEALRPMVVVEIEGTPEGAPQSRLAEIVSVLKPYVRFVFASIDVDRRDVDIFSSTGFRGVGVNIANSRMSEAVLLKHLGQFSERAARFQLKTGARGVRSMSIAVSAVCDGFDFIEGDAVETLVSAPGQVTRLSLEDLFRQSS